MTQERKIIGASASELIITPGPRFVNSTRSIGVSTTVTSTVPNGTKEGDILINCINAVTGDFPGNLTTPSGWTTIVNFQTQSVNFALCVVSWRKANNSEPSSYGWGIGINSRYQACMMRWDNIFAAAPDFIGNITTGNNASATNSVTSPTVSSTKDDSVLITTCGWLSGTSGNTIATPPSELTTDGTVVYNLETTAGNDNSHCVGFEKLSTAGATGSRTWTMPVIGDLATAAMIILQPHTGALHEFTDVDDVGQVQPLDQMPSIIHGYVNDVNGILQVQFTDDIGISETDEDVFNAEGLLQLQPLDQDVVIQQSLFTDVVDLSQAQTVESIQLGAEFDIDELTQAQPFAGINLGAEFDMDSLDQAQLLDTVTVIRNVVYDIDELLHPTQSLGTSDIFMLVHSFTSATSDVNVQALAVDVPPDASDGDFLLGILATDGAGETHSADGAWTTVESSLDSGGHTLSLYKRTVTGTPEPSSYNFTWTSDEKAVGIILLIRGTSENPLQIKTKMTGRSKTPFSLPVTPLVSGTLYLSINSHDQASGNYYTITTPSDLFQELNIGAGPQSGVAIQVGSKFIETETTEPLKTWIMSKKDNWYTISILLQPPGGSFIVDNLLQSQILEQIMFAFFEINEILQTQTIDSVDIISNSDDHQLFMNNINQIQPIDTISFTQTSQTIPIMDSSYNDGLKPGLWDQSIISESWEWFHDHLVGAWFPIEGDVTAIDGATIIDRSLNNHPSLIENSSGDITRLVTERGEALNFSGDSTNDRLNLGSINSFNPLSLFGKNEISVAFGAILESGHGSFPRLIDKSNLGGAEDGWAFWQDTGGSPNAFLFKAEVATGISKQSFIELNVFHHYSMSVDILGGIAEFWTDGVSNGTETGTTGTIPSTTANAAIGNWNHSTDRMWKGPIDYIYLFDALIPADLARMIAENPYGGFRITSS